MGGSARTAGHLPFAAITAIATVAACTLTTSLDGLTGGASTITDAATAFDSPPAFDASGAGDAPAGDDSSTPDAPLDAEIDSGTLETLASNLKNPYAIALDANYVYFTTTGDGKVARVLKTGGTPDVYASALSNPQGILVGGSFLYWADIAGGFIGRCPIASPTICQASGFDWLDVPSPDQLATDGTSIYFSEHVSSGAIDRASTLLPTAQPVVAPLNSPSGVAVDGTNVYFAVKLGGKVAFAPKTSNAISSPTVLASGLGEPFRIAVDSSRVYWTNLSDGTVMTCSLTGCPQGGPVILASGRDSPSGIATDGTRVYWTERGATSGAPTGVVATCDDLTNGCGANPRELANHQGQPMGIALDDTYVYWASGADPGSIQRLAK